MPAVTNKTERLITTHMGEQLTPGVSTEVSDETMAHPTIQQMVTDGFLEAEGAVRRNDVTRPASSPPLTKA